MSHLIGITGNFASTTFNPKNIPGNILWVDGSDPLGTGIAPADTTSISTWKDKSGNGNDMIAQVAATYSANSQNSLGALTFNSSWYRSTTTNIPYYPVDTYFVLKLDSTTVARNVCGVSQVGVDNFNSLTFGEYTASRWHNGSTGSTRTPNTVSSANETSTSFMIMQWSIADSSFYIYRNGVQIATTVSYTWTPTASVVFLLGSKVDITAVNRYVGKIAEVIAYNSQLNTTNRQTVEGYLATKWGLRSDLPVNHPFYDAPQSLQVWLDGNDPLNTGDSGTAGATLTTWTDKSGFGRNMVFSGTGTVSYSNASIRGINTISIALSQGLGTISAAAGLFSNNYCGFIVFRNVSGGTELFGTLDGSSWAIPVEVLADQRYVGVAAGNRAFVGNGAQVTGFANITTMWDFTLTNYASSGGTGVWNEYINGSNVTVTGGTTTGLNAAHTVSSIFFIGRGSASVAYTGQYCEILIYNSAITTIQRQHIEGYLAWKWGIQASLPGAHPYLAAPPVGLDLKKLTFLSSSDIPDPPTGVQMSYVSPTLYVTVKWVASSTAASYTIIFYSNASNSTSGGTILQTITGNTGRVQSTFTPLVGNTFYYATVTSVNTIGNSSPVTSATAVQYTGPAAPLAPTNVAMASFTQGQTTVSVSWTAVSGATSYTIIFYSNASNSTTGGSVFQTITGNTGTSQASSTALVANTFYYATVTAVNAIGSSPASTSSTAVQYIAPLIPPAPTNVTMGSFNPQQTTISASWTAAAGASSYTVNFLSNVSNSTSGGSVWQTITGVTGTSQTSSSTLISGSNGLYYYATVASVSAGGSSSATTSSGNVRYYIPLWVASVLSYWFDAADTSTITSTGNTITTWVNKGVAGNASRGASTSVLTNSTTLNGKNTVRFNASQYLSTPNYTAPSAACSFFIVFRGAANLGSGSGGHWFCFNNSSGRDFFLFYNAGVGNASLRYYLALNTLGGEIDYNFNGTASASAFATGTIISVVVNGTSTTSPQGAWWKGNGITTVSRTGGNSIATYNNFTIGATRSDFVAYNMADFLIFPSAFSTANRQLVEGWLAWKWGLQGTLVAGHPHISASP
jgi:hypothetical protein